MPPWGLLPFLRLFQVDFNIQRILVPRRPQTESEEKQALRARAQVLREEGMTYPEIADQLGISLGATWNLLNKHLLSDEIGT